MSLFNLPATDPDVRTQARADLLKAVPDSIPGLIEQLDATVTADQDQLILTSLEIELHAAHLSWSDLANLIRIQVIAHRTASLKGIINAVKAHPKSDRLNDKEVKFLTDIHRRNMLLTDRQASWLQSISDSLNEPDDDYALRVLAREDHGG